MICLGIRCSTKDYSYVILSGSRQQPSIIVKETIFFPKGYPKGQRLLWFLQEFQLILSHHKVELVVIKETEAMARKGQYYPIRVEDEAMIFLAAAQLDSTKRVIKKVNPTIGKDLGLKGRKKDLDTLDYSAFPNFDKESKNIQDAIRAAWSSLR